MFLIHGALWLALKNEGDLGMRALRFVQTGWPFLLVSAVIFLGWTVFSTRLEDNFLQRPFWLVVPFLAVASLMLIKVTAARKRIGGAFFASCAMIVLVTFTGIIGLFPNLIPSMPPRVPTRSRS
jgi:cytochrome d ubiquinol oxidase subunit II